MNMSEALKKDKLVQLFMQELPECSLHAEIKEEVFEKPESFRIQKLENSFYICGSDAAGVAYGIQSLSEALRENESFVSAELHGEPEVRIRGIDRFIMNSDDESWWLDENYWEKYLQMLAVSRLNRLCLVVGFDTEYLAPPYPFLFDVEGFEEVRLAYDHAGKQKRMDMLRKIGQLCHAYHIEFSFAIWQQQPWENGSAQMVYGLENQEELCRYCEKGIQKLLLECPEIDVLHYRVNYESGVGDWISAEDYWIKQIEAVAEVNRQGRPIQLELRAKGMTDRMVQRACEEGLDVTISTKYCCEHAGLPHHLTQMRSQELADLDNQNSSRRYSYADFLKKPRNYHFLYRLWCDGSTDLFTWGDPDYVRRFVASMEVGNADGFELMPPLTLKGGREFDRHTGWNLFQDEKYQPPFEEERYWLFYRLYGRIGYNRDCKETAWMQEMRARFGENAELAKDIIALSSKIVPFITAFHFPEHPQLWYWTEMSTGAALFGEHNYHLQFKKENDTYQDSLACDEGLFYGISEYVKATGKTDGRYTPLQVYDWLEQIVRKLDEYLKQAPGHEEGWEWNGIILDAQMTGELARFHMHKILAALGLAHFQYRNDCSFLQDALSEMKKAQMHWDELARLGEAYHDNLHFSCGVGRYRRGTWKIYNREIQMDIDKLEELQCNCHGCSQKSVYRKREYEQLSLKVDLPKSHKANTELPVQVRFMTDSVDSLNLRYRHTNQMEGPFRKLEMQKSEEGFFGVVERDYLTPEWDLLIYFETKDKSGDGMIWPGIGNMEELMPYYLVRIEE